MDLSCIWNFEYDNNKNSLESRVHRNDQTLPVEKSLTTVFYCITAEKRKTRKINQKSKSRQRKFIFITNATETNRFLSGLRLWILPFLQTIWLFWNRFFSVLAFRCIQRTHCDHWKLDLSAEKTLSKDWPVHRYLIKPPSFDFLIPGLVQSQSPGVIWMRSRKLLIIKSYEQEN